MILIMIQSSALSYQKIRNAKKNLQKIVKCSSQISSVMSVVITIVLFYVLFSQKMVVRQRYSEKVRAVNNYQTIYLISLLPISTILHTTLECLQDMVLKKQFLKEQDVSRRLLAGRTKCSFLKIVSHCSVVKFPNFHQCSVQKVQKKSYSRINTTPIPNQLKKKSPSPKMVNPLILLSV